MNGLSNSFKQPLTIALAIFAALACVFASEASAARYAATAPKPDQLMMLRIAQAYNAYSGPMCSRAVSGIIEHLTKDKRAWLRSRASREFKRTYRATRGRTTDERNCRWLKDPYNWRSFRGLSYISAIVHRDTFFAKLARALRIAKCRTVSALLQSYTRVPAKLLGRVLGSRC